MGNLEQMPTGEISPPMETKMPLEVLEMDKNILSDAKLIFMDNHELVKEAMFGMGDRKAKEMLTNLAECRERTKDAVKKFRAAKEKIYH
jgi:hypothetical protein